MGQDKRRLGKTQTLESKGVRESELTFSGQVMTFIHISASLSHALGSLIKTVTSVTL